MASFRQLTRIAIAAFAAQMLVSCENKEYDLLFSTELDCSIDLRTAVTGEVRKLASELGWEYAYVQHTTGGERFEAELRDGSRYRSVGVSGYHPRVGYGEAFKAENAGKNIMFDAAGAVVGTPHWLGISANIAGEGDRKRLVQVAELTTRRLERLCGTKRNPPGARWKENAPENATEAAGK